MLMAGDSPHLGRRHAQRHLPPHVLITIDSATVGREFDSPTSLCPQHVAEHACRALCFEMGYAIAGGMVSAEHNLVGLARVSTVLQDAQLPRDALEAAGCVRMVEEKVSARSTARPGLAHPNPTTPTANAP